MHDVSWAGGIVISWRLSSDREAIVHQYPFMSMDTCPIYSKVTLLTIGKVAVIGEWDGKDESFEGWFPLPCITKESPCVPL